MPKFRKKPVIIEAVQWKGNIEDIHVFMSPDKPIYMSQYKNADEILGIETPEGTMIANMNDWIIKGVKGEFYPCKPDIFEETYTACTVE
jgi:hypothetical protein